MSDPAERYRAAADGLGQPTPDPPRRPTLRERAQRVRRRAKDATVGHPFRVLAGLFVLMLAALIVGTNVHHGAATTTGGVPVATGPPDPAADGESSWAPIGERLDYDETDNLGRKSAAAIDVQLVRTATHGDRNTGGDDPQQGSFRVFDVSIEVTAGTVTDLHPDNFHWETPDGRVIDAGRGHSSGSGLATGGPLNYRGAAVGQTVHGQLIFDVPAGAGRLDLTGADGSVVGGWTVGGDHS